MNQFRAVFTLALIATAAGPVRAQAGAKDGAKRVSAIPADARPPKGMCRIWIDGVPAAQQPATTDCPTAVRNRPANGRILFGDDFSDSAKVKSSDKPRLPPNAKGFTGVKPPPSPLLSKRP